MVVIQDDDEPRNKKIYIFLPENQSRTFGINIDPDNLKQANLHLFSSKLYCQQPHIIKIQTLA